MRILVTGAAGMIGRKLAERLAHDGAVGDRSIDRLDLLDAVTPEIPEAPFAVEAVAVDLTEDGAVTAVVERRADVVVHLAAVLSGEAEVDFEKGYRSNVDAFRDLLDAIRRADPPYRPRLVFASSIAVFGGPYPDVIGDEFLSAPQTSYGTQKAIGELLLNDYSRRGFVDGIGIRLPTISVRPGAPNKAASGFFSSIVREPLNGDEAVLPVPDDIRHWHASPRSAVGYLLHAAVLDTSLLGGRRCLTMPGVSVTVGEQIEALRAVAGDEVTALIRREHDEAVYRIVATWPGRFDARRALELGFRAESTFEEIVRVHVEDELGGRIPALGA